MSLNTPIASARFALAAEKTLGGVSKALFLTVAAVALFHAAADVEDVAVKTAQKEIRGRLFAATEGKKSKLYMLATLGFGLSRKRDLSADIMGGTAESHVRAVADRFQGEFGTIDALSKFLNPPKEAGAADTSPLARMVSILDKHGADMSEEELLKLARAVSQHLTKRRLVKQAGKSAARKATDKDAIASDAAGNAIRADRKDAVGKGAGGDAPAADSKIAAEKRGNGGRVIRKAKAA